MDANITDEAELEILRNKVVADYKPVCIHKDGIMVLDDVGGLRGFADFLEKLYESDDKDEAASMLNWAKSQGWKEKYIPPKNLI